MPAVPLLLTSYDKAVPPLFHHSYEVCGRRRGSVAFEIVGLCIHCGIHECEVDIVFGHALQDLRMGGYHHQTYPLRHITDVGHVVCGKVGIASTVIERGERQEIDIIGLDVSKSGVVFKLNT